MLAAFLFCATLPQRTVGGVWHAAAAEALDNNQRCVARSLAFALIKKGLLVKSRAPVRLAVEALAPIALSLVLFLLFNMQININSIILPAGTGAAFTLKDAGFFRTSNGVTQASNPTLRGYARLSTPLDVYYSVCCMCNDTEKPKEVVSKAIGSGFSPILLGNADEASTRCQYPKCLAVVVFSECSNDWNYTIRMPSELVANTSLIIAAAPNSEAEPIKFGGINAYMPSRVASYLVHGFVSLQAAMNRQILSLADPTVSWNTQPRVTAFTPFTQAQVDSQNDAQLALRKAAAMRGIVRQASAVVVALVFSPMVYILGAEISLERELRVRDTLKIMGMYDSAYYFSLFMSSLIVVIPSLVILSGVLVSTVFPDVDYKALISIFLQFAISCLPLPFITCLFVRSPSWAGFAAIGPLVLLMAIAIIVTVVTSISESNRIPASLVSLVGVQQAFDILCTFQANAYDTQKSVKVDLTFTLPEGGAQANSYSSMCLLDAVLYWMIFLYLEAIFPGEQGVPRRWHFIFTMPFRRCFPSKGTAVPTRRALNVQDEEALANFEPASEGSVCAVETQNLTKIFPALRRVDQPKVAVNNLSMKMYVGQIMALLGHNSAGKSTTLSMLTGCLEATSGSVLLRGSSGLQDTRLGRVPIGFCPQYDVLWPSLTVYETMCVYAQIKGLSLSEMDAAIDKMIESLEMTSKKHYLTGSLSGGQKRRLCVANALIGECKIVFLDEPTSGMDPFSRRALWSLIKEYQPGRCIVFTTHYMDEADILGDTVAVLSHGSLRVSGSPLFLKRRFGCGYTLSVLLPQIGTSDTQQSVEEVMSTVRKHVPSASVVMQEGQEVIINLSAASFTSFPNMLLSLDESRQASKIRDYGISLTSLDEVFMRIEDDGNAKPPPAAAIAEHNSVESVQIDAEEQSQADGQVVDSLMTETPVPLLGESASSRRRKTIERAEKQFGSDSMDVSKLKETYVPVRPAPGGASFWSQFYGMFVKRAVTFKRDLSILSISLILPIMIAVGAAAIMQQIPSLNCEIPAIIYSAPLSLDLSLLFNAKIPTSPYTLVPFDSKTEKASNFRVEPDAQYVKRAYSSIPPSFSISDSNVLTSINANRSNIPGALQACCSDLNAASSGLNAFYNAALLHSLPSVLTAAYSSLLSRVNNGTIACQSWPLPKEDTEFFTPEAGKSINGNIYGTMFLAVSVGIALGSLVVSPVAEKGNRSKFLQVVSGVRSSSYWAATFTFDFCLWTTYVSVYVVILQIFQVSPFTGPTGFALWIIMLLSGAATLVMVYCWSCKLSTPSSALGAAIVVIIAMSIFLLIGWVSSTVVMIANGLPLSVSETVTIPLIIALVFVSIFPPLSMLIGSALLANMVKVLCSMGMKPDASATWFKLFVLVNILQIVIYTVVLFVLESRSKQSVTHPKRQLSKDTAAINDIKSFETDADVKAEHDEVFAGKRDGDHVVAKCLRQEFSSPKTGKVKVAVAGISFSVKKGEVLGILGPNGAGKTSTLSILTSDHMPVGGTCAICRNDSTDPDAVRRCIGVCPQHDALFMHMTPTENIYLFARLRGIPEQDIEKMCLNLLRLVKMEPHAHVLCGKLSGGNKRKISLVVSLIGVPPVIFMDEPSSGMDIIAKRFFWRVIEALRTEHAIILTTHSMEEAESVCSRVGIIVDGKMKCLGSSQRIKSVYGMGYDVQLKPGLENQVPTCKKFMESKLPASILVEEHGRTLKYTVPRESVASVSSIFETVGKLSLDIEMSEFGVCQTSLEQVFLHFGKQQRILLGIDELQDSQVDTVPYKSPFDVLPESHCCGVFLRGCAFFLVGCGMVPAIMSLVLAVFLFVFVIPFPIGRMYLRLMAVQFSPLDRQFSSGPLTSDKRVMNTCFSFNVLFFFCGGGFLIMFHLLMAFVLFVSIIGYKAALLHLELLKLVAAPYGRHILAADAPNVSSMSNWQIFNYGRGVYPCCCCDPNLPPPQKEQEIAIDNAALLVHMEPTADRRISSPPAPSQAYAYNSAQAFMVGAARSPPPLPPKPARLLQ